MKASSLASLLLALFATGEVLAAAQPVTVAWTVAPARSDGKPQAVQLSLSHRSAGNHTQISRTVPLAQLPGLSGTQLASPTGMRTRFRIPRAAGDLDCQGIVRQGSGAGNCAFLANAGFAREIARHGIPAPTPAQQFALAMHNVDLGLIAELRRQGYAPLDLDQISSAAIHGVTAEYLRAMDAAGTRAGTVDNLVQMRVHRIDPAYVRELALAGPSYRNLKVDQLVSMRIHRVTPAFVRDMAAAGYKRLTPEQLVTLRIHGVDPNDARRANAALRRGN